MEEEKVSRGRPRKIESPEKLLEYFNQYIEDTKSNPIIVVDYVGKDGIPVDRKKERPLTIDGFECWLFDKKIINDLGDYLSNKDGRYSDFSTICSHIKRKTRADQIDGGMAGIYNPSITQRLNNLTEKQEVQSNVDLTTDGKPLNQNISVEIVAPREDED